MLHTFFNIPRLVSGIMTPKPVILMILDGWGYAEPSPGNAVTLAETPNLDGLIRKYPWSLNRASGKAVGLPEGQMGNSEVGHMNIGAGRIVYQDLTLIDKEIEDGSFFTNPVLLKAVRDAGKEHALHLMGLFSHGGVHSSLFHLEGLVKLAHREGISEVYIHAFGDGRDVPPLTIRNDLKEFDDFLKKEGCGELASVTGRYYAMDRDRRWDRTQKAYDALTLGSGVQAEGFSGALDALERSIEGGETDEFIRPIVITKNGKPAGLIRDGDSVIFFNFRPDRARQLTRALTDPDFDGFVREKTVRVNFVCMTTYDETMNLPVAYPPKDLKNTLDEILSKAGKKQLRIAETEKYAHVTFFFNGGVEEPAGGEDRILIPSPKVATYDLQPEMSAYLVADRLVSEIGKGIYDVIIVNFANMDMVGHTGSIPAAVKAVEAVDECVGRVVDAAEKSGGVCLITADHGNAECMINPETGGPHTAHTTNPVRLIYADPSNLDDDAPNGLKKIITDGRLCDLAPTILEILGMEQPPEMTGTSLLRKSE